MRPIRAGSAAAPADMATGPNEHVPRPWAVSDRFGAGHAVIGDATWRDDRACDWAASASAGVVTQAMWLIIDGSVADLMRRPADPDRADNLHHALIDDAGRRCVGQLNHAPQWSGQARRRGRGQALTGAPPGLRPRFSTATSTSTPFALGSTMTRLHREDAESTGRRPVGSVANPTSTRDSHPLKHRIRTPSIF